MNAGEKHWRASVATVIGAVAIGLGSASAVELTPEQHCQIAKAEANWKWHRCRSMVSTRDLRRDLSDDAVERLHARCDDQHVRAFESADQKALQQEERACAGDSAGVKVGMLGNTAAILGSSPSRDNFGVNIFGDSGNGALQGAMISTLFQHGVRKFRVNNIGGWPEDADEAINEEAGMLSASERAKVSVYVPSQYFGTGQAAWQNFDVATTKSNFAQWSNIPHWIIQLDACNPVDISSPVYCPNPTETGLGALTTTAQLNDYINQIKNAVPAFQGQPYTVEFVIPYQDSSQSPDSKLAQVKQATVDAFPQVRFTLEKTEYPFWGGDGATSTNFPFAEADAFDAFAKSQGFAGAYFAESGWARNCSSSQPHAPATLPDQCAYLKSSLHGAYADPQFVTYWWVMGAEDVGDGCGAESWGLFTTPASPVLGCPGSF
jgi:hypothetical protein